MSLWDTEELGSGPNVVCWVLLSVTAVCFALRVYCRILYTSVGGGFYLDDLITLLCLLVLLAFCIFLSIGIHYGVGQRWASISESQGLAAVKYNAIINGLVPWVCSLPKFAIIATLKRILNFGRKTTWLFWSLAISSQITVIALTVWDFLQCQPVAFQWDRSIEGGVCASTVIFANLSWATFLYSTVLDLFFALYPIPFVMRLNLPLKARISVAISLSLSSLAFAVSIYKFSVFGKVVEILSVDPTFPMAFLAMTHVIEGCFLMISTSLVTLRPLFREIRDYVSNSCANSKYASDRRSKRLSWTFAPSHNASRISEGVKDDDVEHIIGTQHSTEVFSMGERSPSNDDRHETDIIIQKTIEVSVSRASVIEQRDQQRQSIVPNLSWNRGVNNE